ncbi:hypothetical protein SAMN05421643_11835 [Acinetobacter kyonggiensis]|uniref:Uncharacterized protein n=1 Tax=Acinetobacter kyonggiensis TaxID=595670 RepID=A0A1H3LJ08_9GAMM|nr:hypothetical protein SAMN05421643_11835 [Acinetobacter kyonggiensis]
MRGIFGSKILLYLFEKVFDRIAGAVMTALGVKLVLGMR